MLTHLILPGIERGRGIDRWLTAPGDRSPLLQNLRAQRARGAGGDGGMEPLQRRSPGVAIPGPSLHPSPLQQRPVPP
jgi:hypothetical protein